MDLEVSNVVWLLDCYYQTVAGLHGNGLLCLLVYSYVYRSSPGFKTSFTPLIRSVFFYLGTHAYCMQILKIVSILVKLSLTYEWTNNCVFER